MEGWGKRLKVLAKQGFGGVGKLAEKLGMSSSHLSQYIGEENSPGLEFFKKVADVGGNVNWLLNGSGEMLDNSNNWDFDHAGAMASFPNSVNEKLEHFKPEKRKAQKATIIVTDETGKQIAYEIG
jgi:transcriptional regulator with XRE-family HTH domain